MSPSLPLVEAVVVTPDPLSSPHLGLVLPVLESLQVSLPLVPTLQEEARRKIGSSSAVRLAFQPA